MSFFSLLRPRAALLAEIETLRAANAKLTRERDTARVVSWVRIPPAIVAENEALRLENAKLRYNLVTAWLASWVRHSEPPSRRRSGPHTCRPDRHREDDPQTELRPRAALRRESKQQEGIL